MSDGEFRWSVVDGVVRMIDSNGIEALCGDISPTPQQEQTHRQQMAQADADTTEDVEAYERLAYEDSDFQAVQSRMVELAALADPEDAKRINTSYRTFNEEYAAVKNLMVGEEVDRPRTSQITELREQLAEEDSQAGGRNTARREELVQRIARLHGGGGR